jgi:hypothetical protein
MSTINDLWEKLEGSVTQAAAAGSDAAAHAEEAWTLVTKLESEIVSLMARAETAERRVKELQDQLDVASGGLPDDVI